REDARPGKPATLLDIARDAHRIIGVDLSDHLTFRGAVLTLDGELLDRAEVPLDGAQGAAATAKAVELVRLLVARATAPILGVGVGTPGVVDFDGTVLLAPNLDWHGEALRATLAAEFALPIIVANDANAACLAEHGFGEADGDTLLVTIGHGV